jgi:hypothetical protein
MPKAAAVAAGTPDPVESAPVQFSTIDPLVNLAARRHLVAEVRAKMPHPSETMSVGSFLALLNETANEAAAK